MRLLLIPLMLLLLSSCKNDTAKTETEVIATETDTITTVPEDTTAETITGAIYRYNDTIGTPVKVSEVTNETQVSQLVDVINQYHGDGKVKLDYVKTSADTVYVKIDDSMYLTQQMGTLGPHAYLSVATFTLTEKPGINYVTFDFEEGDHAAPGTYSRKSFNNH